MIFNYFRYVPNLYCMCTIKYLFVLALSACLGYNQSPPTVLHVTKLLFTVGFVS